MKLERVLLIVLFILLLVGILIPILLLVLIKNKAIAGQIGDTLGGTTAPFVNISAILAVILTYLYQKRNDKKQTEKELILSTFENLKNEFEKINYEVTIKSKDGKEIKHYSGANAFRETIRSLNNGEYSFEDLNELHHYKSMLNVFQFLNNIMASVIENEILTNTDKQLFLSQFSLFYRNNLFVDKEQRGDEICKFHNKRHNLPAGLYTQILNIESKII